jgi:hypothetical protein
MHMHQTAELFRGHLLARVVHVSGFKQEDVYIYIREWKKIKTPKLSQSSKPSISSSCSLRGVRLLGDDDKDRVTAAALLVHVRAAHLARIK